eukprot:2167772-Lingulodinium_polyedra.AAC.1
MVAVANTCWYNALARTSLNSDSETDVAQKRAHAWTPGAGKIPNRTGNADNKNLGLRATGPVTAFGGRRCISFVCTRSNARAGRN